MSSHADTIRTIRFRADLVRRAGFDFYQAPQVAQDALAGLAGEMDKWAAALDALLAENQRLREREETVRGNLYLYGVGELEAVEAVIAIREALAGDAE